MAFYYSNAREQGNLKLKVYHRLLRNGAEIYELCKQFHSNLYKLVTHNLNIVDPLDELVEALQH